MSYKTNQWYNLDDFSSRSGRVTDSGYAVPDSDNQDFIYPTRRVFTLDRNGEVSSKTLRRGYIRSLLGESANKRCQFQFNPASINQSVQQNTTVLNFLQSDVYQYAQPMPGNVTFNFGLLFDRTMEVNSGVSENLQRELGDPRTNSDPWNALSANNIGVLHDLAALFGIIGLGVSDFMDRVINDENSNYDNLTKAYLENTIELFTPEDGDMSTTSYRNSLNDLVGINRGNSAFLIPLPCRIVFSSLYIVEGLVQDINILFTKFNTQMVPIQCRVDITMESKYIGFAKEDTFFSYVLDEVSDKGGINTSSFASESEIEGSTLEAIKADLGRIVIKMDGDPIGQNRGGGYLGDYVSRSINTTRGYGAQSINQFPEPASSSEKWIKLEFPDIENGSARISGLFASGSTVDIQFRARVNVYRVIEPQVDTALVNELNSVSTSMVAGSEWFSPTVGAFDSVFTDFVRGSRNGDYPETYTIDDDESDEDYNRTYLNVIALWVARLDADNRYTTDNESDYGVTTVNTPEEWDAVKDKKTKGAQTRDYYSTDDRSTEIYDNPIGGETSRTAETKHNYFNYYINYTLGVSVTVDGKTSTVNSSRLVKFKPTNLRATNGDYELTRTFDFSNQWQNGTPES